MQHLPLLFTREPLDLEASGSTMMSAADVGMIRCRRRMQEGTVNRVLHCLKHSNDNAVPRPNCQKCCSLLLHADV